MVMEILISVVLLFGGIAALVVIHICIARRAFMGRYEISRLVQGNGGGGGSEKISNEELKKLPCFDYKVEEAEVDCVVCLENLKMGDKCRLLPNCKHSFHVECIDSWLLKTPICPVCRTSACVPSIGVVLKESAVGVHIT